MSDILTFKNIDSLCKTDKDSISKHILIPKQPFRMSIVGFSGSGKTNMVVQLITNKLIVDRLYVVSKHLQQPKMDYMFEYFENLDKKVNQRLNRKKKSLVKMNLHRTIQLWTCDLEDLPDPEELDKEYNNVILFDDLMTEKDLRKVETYFIRGRHSNSTCIWLAQSFFTGVPRKVRLNSSHFVLFNAPSKSEIKRISNEVAPDLTQKEFMDLFNRAIEEDYSFFFIDTTQKRKLLKYRKNLDEALIVD